MAPPVHDPALTTWLRAHGARHHYSAISDGPEGERHEVECYLIGEDNEDLKQVIVTTFQGTGGWELFVAPSGSPLMGETLEAGTEALRRHQHQEEFEHG